MVVNWNFFSAGSFFYRINYSTESDPHGCELKIVFFEQIFSMA